MYKRRLLRKIFFLSYNKANNNLQETWFLDMMHSNHMISKGEMLSLLDHYYKYSINLGIYYTPNLKHYLLSVGKLIEKNYKLVFDDVKCVIYDKNYGNRVTIIPIKSNGLFPLKFVGR